MLFQASRAATGTLLSRGSGLVRDVLFAYVFGTSFQYDAYIVAISIPFLLRSIFAEGGLSSAFVPIYKRSKDKNAFATGVFLFLLFTAGVVSLLLAIFAPNIVYLFATGLRQNAKAFAYAVKMERFTAFFLLFISLWAWGAGILNSHKSFFVPSLSPMFNNLFIIGGILLSPLFHPHILSVAIGFSVGGAFQFLFEMPFLKKIGFKPVPLEDKSERNEFLRAFFFTSLSVALSQTNFFVDTNIASRLASGSISILQYANRIYQLPMGILIVSLASVYLPEMSEKRNVQELKASIHDAFSKLFFIMIPSTFFIALFSRQIIDVIYAHGAFNTQSAFLTSEVLLIYIMGFPFQSSIIIMNRALYAFKSAKTATLVTLFGVLTNVVGDLTLGLRYSVNGMAFATTLSAMVSFTILYLIERKKYSIRISEVKGEFFKILFASLLSTIPLYLSSLIKNPWFSLILGFFSFSISFMVLSHLFKSENASRMWNIFNIKRKKS
nr:murein biosynthesis integral membrane protein MurJ [Mesoaciditoga lauensis]